MDRDRVSVIHSSFLFLIFLYFFSAFLYFLFAHFSMKHSTDILLFWEKFGKDIPFFFLFLQYFIKSYSENLLSFGDGKYIFSLIFADRIILDGSDHNKCKTFVSFM